MGLVFTHTVACGLQGHNKTFPRRTEELTLQKKHIEVREYIEATGVTVCQASKELNIPSRPSKTS